MVCLNQRFAVIRCTIVFLLNDYSVFSLVTYQRKRRMLACCEISKTERCNLNVIHYFQIKHGNVSHAKAEAEKAAAKKKTSDDELRDLNKLLKPVTDMPKIARGINCELLLIL